MADITSKDENDYIKAVLDGLDWKIEAGLDYLIGGMDVIINKQFIWTTGKASFCEFKR